MKEYLLSDRCADLALLIIGGPKPEYYIHKMIIKFLDFLASSKWLKNNPYSVPIFLSLTKNNPNRHGNRHAPSDSSIPSLSKWSISKNDTFLTKIGFLDKYVADNL